MTADQPSTIGLTVNGRRHEVAPGTTLDEFLSSQGVDPTFTAVERNRQIVPRAERQAVVVAEGDVFEVVHFVGGG